MSERLRNPDQDPDLQRPLPGREVPLAMDRSAADRGTFNEVASPNASPISRAPVAAPTSRMQSPIQARFESATRQDSPAHHGTTLPPAIQKAMGERSAQESDPPRAQNIGSRQVQEHASAPRPKPPAWVDRAAGSERPVAEMNRDDAAARLSPEARALVERARQAAEREAQERQRSSRGR